MYNRTDACCKERLSKYSVYITGSSLDTSFAKSYATFPDPYEIIPTGGAEGNIVGLRLEKTGAINLAEFEVYKPQLAGHFVQIKVIDDSSKIGLHNVFISVNNQFYNTNSKGEVKIELAEGHHELVMKKAGYSESLVDMEISTDTSILVPLKSAALVLNSGSKIAREKVKYKISLHPNPADDILIIEAQFSIQKMSVFNILGEKIESYAVGNDRFVLHTQGYRNGIYFLRVAGETGHYISAKFYICR